MYRDKSMDSQLLPSDGKASASSIFEPVVVNSKGYKKGWVVRFETQFRLIQVYQI